jgi:hypothetical protein
MANEAIRKQYRIDEILRRIPEDQGEFFVEFVPWPENVNNWKRSARETLGEEGERVLLRTIWDNPTERDSRALIDVVVCGSAGDAVESLASRLEGNQLASLPEGPSGLGLASFQHPDFAPPAILFVRANLAITVASFGRKAVDIGNIASRINAKLDERPVGLPLPSDLATLVAYPLIRVARSARRGEEVLLGLNLPARKDEDRYVKLFVNGGIISRRQGQLFTRVKDAQQIEIDAFLLEPARAPYSEKATIKIQ